MSFFSPAFLVNNIDIIGQIISVMILLVFDDFFTQRITFNGIDALKELVLRKSKEKFRKKYRFLIKYTFEFLATITFIFYFFMGYWLLSEYVLVPILLRLQSIILVIILVFFVVMSWMLNNRKIRRKYFGYN